MTMDFGLRSRPRGVQDETARIQKKDGPPPPPGVAWMQNPPAGGEEGLQEGCGFFGYDPGTNFDLMI
jgi:hypothetical protein